MSDAQARRFLTTGTRIGKPAVVRADGSPMVAPVWFDLDDDGSVVFTTGAQSIEGKAIRRDGRVALCGRSDTALQLRSSGRHCRSVRAPRRAVPLGDTPCPPVHGR